MLKMLRNGSHSHRMRCFLWFGTISIISLSKEYLQIRAVFIRAAGQFHYVLFKVCGSSGDKQNV